MTIVWWLRVATVCWICIGNVRGMGRGGNRFSAKVGSVCVWDLYWESEGDLGIFEGGVGWISILAPSRIPAKVRSVCVWELYWKCDVRGYLVGGDVDFYICTLAVPS